VGGIGVLNIMLVSVTERTREIGIRKAIGATSRAILKQFLLESTVLAGLGGLLGVGVGVGLAFLVRAIAPAITPSTGALADFTPVLSAPPVLAAFTISLGIGLLAGSLPGLPRGPAAPHPSAQIRITEEGINNANAHLHTFLNERPAAYRDHWYSHWDHSSCLPIEPPLLPETGQRYAIASRKGDAWDVIMDQKARYSLSMTMTGIRHQRRTSPLWDKVKPITRQWRIGG